tara:strand:- start:1185 stop:1829 length:645 start_codon:yes stop_codon:yes gene_type:complete
MQSPPLNSGFLDEKLTYTPEGELLDSFGGEIMMKWEDNIMKHQAAEICINGGDILNVGFGLGLMDKHIQSHNPNTHWIIESHPDVQRKIIEDGWLKKPNVKVIFKPWQEVLNYLPKFDGIYFDTWLESQDDFDYNIKNMLKPNGVYSFFNNPDSNSQTIQSRSHSILKEFCDISSSSLDISKIIPSNHKLNRAYWKSENKIYWIPKCKLKENYR